MTFVVFPVVTLYYWHSFYFVLQVNIKAHHVEYNCFYIPDVTSLVDIQEDYLKWFLRKAETVSPTAIVQQMHRDILLQSITFSQRRH